jgi:16S rRNA processing protein RimM
MSGQTPMASPEFIQVAVVTSAHGTRGEVKLLAFIEDTSLLESSGVLLNSAGKELFSVRITGEHKQGVIVKPSTSNDRNAADLLKGTGLYLPASLFPEAEDGEYYYRELVGLRAILPDGSTYGTISSVLNFGAGDILECTFENGNSELLPFNEHTVTNVDIQAGILHLVLPEYVEAKEGSA